MSSPEFPKPRIVVSKCLGFAACRYNGENLHDKIVSALAPYVEYLPVCPEVEAGYGIPRDPIRIVEEEGRRFLFQPAVEKDVTQAMDKFLSTYFSDPPEAEGFLLKNRSPSCGFQDVKVYQGRSRGASTRRGPGFFGGAVLNTYENCAVEDEGRLKNFTIREHFFTQIFAYAGLRVVQQKKTMRALSDFHASQKYLLMACDQKRLRLLGKLVANHENRPIQEVFSLYEQSFLPALKKIPTPGQWINVIEHAMGGFSKKLTEQERHYFVRTIEEYRDERIPLSVLLHLVESAAIRFEQTYLLEQSFLHPYPPQLVEITDSGKGRSR
ncbi:YbgA family protein [Chitinivibrio alkaliphilus]|uniref:DUF1722 domain-containing protein n=1 Tax=Chitinivibrio alkaliphilus ACht1 TaxID=1313304 RepID=U7D6X7_9BACT|nr:DUF523 and DUF1722 domain-containing protein [Chitinivibrio alkaliphilus]ERP38725.1 hypothetical protein CALK_0743 [Chitinivibrio alkaliphilus ACht1]